MYINVVFPDDCVIVFAYVYFELTCVYAYTQLSFPNNMFETHLFQHIDIIIACE